MIVYLRISSNKLIVFCFSALWSFYSLKFCLLTGNLQSETSSWWMICFFFLNILLESLRSKTGLDKCIICLPFAGMKNRLSSFQPHSYLIDHKYHNLFFDPILVFFFCCFLSLLYLCFNFCHNHEHVLLHAWSC